MVLFGLSYARGARLVFKDWFSIRFKGKHFVNRSGVESFDGERLKLGTTIILPDLYCMEASRSNFNSSQILGRLVQYLHIMFFTRVYDERSKCTFWLSRSEREELTAKLNYRFV